MNFAVRIIMLLLMCSKPKVDGRTKEARSNKRKLTELWANATDEDLNDFARFFSESNKDIIDKYSYENLLRDAKENRTEARTKMWN